ncbi:MAG: nuclear transport factor 2 family protein [Planctomycetes bacterium]|nr:nuclear transport factor 2 family protein [Planctomycetota bacterium]
MWTTASSVRAEDPQVESVRQAAAAYLKALEEGDREALLAAWTPDGRYIDAAGRAYTAHELIETEFASGQAEKRNVGSVRDETVRLVTPDVAILDGTTEHVARPGEPTPKSRFTAVWVKRDGRWLLDSLRESIVPLPPTNSRLAELRWLLGTFAGLADDGSHVVVTADLSHDGNFVLRKYVVRNPDETVYTVSQRIGWDPLADSFRSWSFDSKGGYTNGTWTRQANSWIVHNSGVTSEGRRTAATGLYTNIDHEGFVLEIVGAMLDDQTRPDIKVKMMRHTQQD